ncbi:MAG: LamG-like jellyroll fold domain-containing protein, partial [Planctomycetota bacterium]
RVYSPVVTPGESRWLEADVDEAPLPPGAIFSVGQSVDFNGEKSDHIQIPHDEDFELAEGTYALTFRVEDTRGRQTLLSKDHRGYQEGGHLTAWVNGDRVEARYQSDSKSETVRSGRGAVDAGEEHHLAISFGDDGLRLYLDGQLVDSEDDFDQGMQLNTNSLVLGASTVRRDGDRSNLRDAFEGTILSFELYGSQLNDDSISDLANGLSGIAGQSIQSGGGAVARGDSLSIKSTNLPGSTTSKLTSTGDDVGGMSSYSRSTAWQLDQADDDERIWDAESVDAALHSLLTHHVG